MPNSHYIVIIWWLIFEIKPFQFCREIWIQVVVILLQLYSTPSWVSPLECLRSIVFSMKSIFKGWLLVERTEGDIEWRGPLIVPVPGNRGRGGDVFPNASMVFGEGESFFKQFNGFRGRGWENLINGFSMFSKVTPVAPVSFFSIL
jgi:hypothetical protein